MLLHNLLKVLATKLLCRAVVFGRVVEGMTTVKRMEVVGQRSGKPSRRVIIADSGQVGLLHYVHSKPAGTCLQPVKQRSGCLSAELWALAFRTCMALRTWYASGRPSCPACVLLRTAAALSCQASCR